MFALRFVGHPTLITTDFQSGVVHKLRHSIRCFFQTYWQFYLIQSFGAIGHCKFSLLRSLMSKCIAENEVGKMFSLLAVIAAVAPLVANPIFRQLYNQTLVMTATCCHILFKDVLTT